jgi:Transposase DDE domain
VRYFSPSHLTHNTQAIVASVTVASATIRSGRAGHGQSYVGFGSRLCKNAALSDFGKSRIRAAEQGYTRGSGMVGYNVQAAVDTTNHLIVAHEVSNVGTDKSQLANMANQAKAALEAESLEAFADRGYFKGEEILACEEAGITVTLPNAARLIPLFR